MAINIVALSNDQPENLIENHRRKGVTGALLYIQALHELEARKGKGLDFEKSLSIILQAALHAVFSATRNWQTQAARTGIRCIIASVNIYGDWSSIAT